ncbi:sugar phosphate nucleotidyltransferase [Actinophytocola sediminis]
MSKAVIAVAGAGSRFFPITKTINKCMLPVLNQPVIDYAVADCLAAGVSQIAIVTSPGETGRQVRHYFTEDPDLRDQFTARGWHDKYEPLAHLHTQADFTFIEQPRDDRYGTALPAILAADFIGTDDFLLLAGDDLLLRHDGGSDLADLVTTRDHTGTPAAIAAATVPGTDAHHYGVLTPRTTTDTHPLLAEIIEKPHHHPHPTAYINISRTLLPADSVIYFDKLRPAPNGEYQATDAINAYARDHPVAIHPITGDYHDCGNTTGWLTANNAAHNTP